MSSIQERQQIYLTPRWRRLRAAIIERDLFQCCKCGIPPDRFEVDHIQAIADGGAVWDPDNLQTLCPSCHRAKHSPKKSDLSRQWDELVAKQLELQEF